MNSSGRYLIDKIETAIDIIHWITLFFFPPNILFSFITVNTINKIKEKSSILAKRNSSKASISRMTSPMNRIRILTVSFSPSVSCSRPWRGPARTNGVSPRR